MPSVVMLTSLRRDGDGVEEGIPCVFIGVKALYEQTAAHDMHLELL